MLNCIHFTILRTKHNSLCILLNFIFICFYFSLLGQSNVESRLESSLTASNKLLENIFSISSLAMLKKSINGKETEENMPVVTADIPALVAFLVQQRNLDPEDMELQLGLDGGQGILKVCLLVYQAVDSEKFSGMKRMKYSDGVGGRMAKMTSVKRLMVIAAAPGVEESWHNIKTILDKLEISSLSGSILSVDMKVQLILCGKQTASSKHPCPYCECSPPFTCNCPRNTIGSLESHYASYVSAGSKKSTAKNFQNCVNPPLLQGAPDLQIIKILSFPELHVMTGVVGHLATQMMKEIPEGEEVISQFIKDQNISWCAYRPGTFEGNQARKFLKFSNKLVEPAKNLPEPSQQKAVAFVNTIMQFNSVVIACFGQELQPNFKEEIIQFEALYRELSISVTPKVHLVLEHAHEFLESKNFVAGLGAWSEQAMESVHHDLKIEWERTKVKTSHPDFEKKFLECLVKYNSKHV